MPKKIVIIDDEPEICKAVTEYLNDVGYSAFYALNGEDGLKVIEKEFPRLILLDIGLPGMDGIQIMREINSRFPHVAVIVLSGHKDNETVAKMIELGACEYITKPINLETLANQFIKDIIGPAND